jgi:hypothetical protein
VTPVTLHAQTVLNVAMSLSTLLSRGGTRSTAASFYPSHIQSQSRWYGAPRIFLDLREASEKCSEQRVARLMRINEIRALHGHRTPRIRTTSGNAGLGAMFRMPAEDSKAE